MAGSSARGLRVIQAIQGYTKRNPNSFDGSLTFNRIKIFNVGDDGARARFMVEQQMCNFFNKLHGGYITSVIDVLSVVQLLAVREGKLAWTTNLNVHFLNAASVGEQVTVETSPIRITARTILTEATAFNDTTGLVVAKALNTFSFTRGELQKETAEKFLKLDISRND